MSVSPQVKPKVVGMAWYTPESWRKLQAVTEGLRPVCDSYDDFVGRAEEIIRVWTKDGITVEKAPVDVAHMAAWCKRHGLKLDSRGRAIHGSVLLTAGGDREELDRMGFEDRSQHEATTCR